MFPLMAPQLSDGIVQMQFVVSLFSRGRLQILIALSRVQSIPDKIEFPFWCLCVQIVDISPFSMNVKY